MPVPRGSADVRIVFAACRDHPSPKVVLRDTIRRNLCHEGRRRGDEEGRVYITHGHTLCARHVHARNTLEVGWARWTCVKGLSHESCVLTESARRPEKLQNAVVRAVRSPRAQKQLRGISVGRREDS